MMPLNFYGIFNHLPKAASLDIAKPVSKKLLIYFDRGVSAYSAYSCLTRFQTLVKKSWVTVSFISNHAIKQDDWEQNTLALVIPGGRSKPYYSSLGPEGNRRIEAYVHQGGSYLGICAGAYYASGKTEFELGTSLEMKLDAGLHFFPGKAIGPAYGCGQFGYFSLQGAKAARISWTDQEELASGNEGFVYYNGGCYFATHSDDGFRPLAQYLDIKGSPIAVLEGNIGAGKVILTGVHFESNPYWLRYYPCSQVRSKVMRNLIQDEPYQRAVLLSILSRMGFPKESFSPVCLSDIAGCESDKRSQRTSF